MGEKAEAYDFLQRVEKRLNMQLPPPHRMRASVEAIWSKPKVEKSPQEQLACKENVFLYHFALPELAEEMKSIEGVDVNAIKKSLRCEYYSKFPQLSASNAFRKDGHPFSKRLGLGAEHVMATWKKQGGTLPLNQVYPDVGLSDPFPFKIVFDAKFFDKESLGAAETVLVEGVYETAFYRGLPHGNRWGYDYGCLLAYDASECGYLKQAWDSVVRKSLFWDGANVFVIITRGDATE